jgi:hypothetical protein
MAPTTQDVYDVLKSIDATLATIANHFGAVRSQAVRDVAGVPDVAFDADLDGPYGNQPIRAKDPKDWTGESQLGKPLSECPPAYLDLVAARLDYFAQHSDDPKKAKYNRLDAARARGWAQRLRNGWTPPKAEPFGATLIADDIPF